MRERSSILAQAGVCLLALLLVAGLYMLLSWRFARGDVYAAYSSLRADPIGCRAYYDALSEVPGRRLSRFYRPARELPEASSASTGTRLFVLGLSPWELYSLRDEALLDFVHGGGVLLVALASADYAISDLSQPSDAACGCACDADSGSDSDNDSGSDCCPAPPSPASLSERLSLPRLRSLPPPVAGTDRRAHLAAPSTTLPADLLWRDRGGFDAVPADWSALYILGGKPVVLERSWGRGRIVLCAGSYLFSNEALSIARETAFLAWCAGEEECVIFNEWHLGVVEQPGLVTLMRRARLHGLVIGVLILFGMVVWRQRCLPLCEDDEDEALPTSAAAGLAHLLQANVPPSQLLAACRDEWARDALRPERAEAQSVLDDINAELAANSARPAKQRRSLTELYNYFCDKLGRSRQG
ncbi:MAG: DUF4350 domain-containing protein [Lentisphaerae bacterium]|nr:DUF4350 domain-containing protein [Lentisphaerota bacterium]